MICLSLIDPTDLVNFEGMEFIDFCLILMEEPRRGEVLSITVQIQTEGLQITDFDAASISKVEALFHGNFVKSDRCQRV